MKKLLLLPLGLLLGLGGLQASGPKNCSADYTRTELLALPEDKVRECSAESKVAITALRESDAAEKRAAQTRKDADELAAKIAQANADKAMADAAAAKALAEKNKILIGAECKTDDVSVEQCKTEFTCNGGQAGSKFRFACAAKSNAAEDMVKIKNIIAENEFKDLGTITRDTIITDEISMPEEDSMIGFKYTPTEGRLSKKTIWYIIRDDKSPIPTIKIYRFAGKRISTKTLWEEMATIANDSTTFKELADFVAQAIQKNKGLILQPNGTMVLDCLAKDPKKSARFVFGIKHL